MPEGNPHRAAVLELVINVAAPTIILTFFSGDAWLGPMWGLLLALAFPLGHGLTTMALTRKVSPIAVLVVVSVLLTGGIGLLELEVSWFAWKEAAFPLAMGVGAVASLRTRWPALSLLLDPLIDTPKVDALLEARGERAAHAQAMARATWRVGAVLVVTAVATFVFARFMVVSPTGTTAFSEELGRYTGWSFPAIGVPSTLVMMWVLSDVLLGLERRTGEKIEALLR